MKISTKRMRAPMRMLLAAMAILLAPVAGIATADGSWLKKVPAADRARTNPMAGSADAAEAGKTLFKNNCAKCHGPEAEGKGSRPSLRSQRVQDATDGELAWLIKNGEAYKGMPSWGALPEPERWQIIAYLRSLNAATTGGRQ